MGGRKRGEGEGTNRKGDKDGQTVAASAAILYLQDVCDLCLGLVVHPIHGAVLHQNVTPPGLLHIQNLRENINSDINKY